MNLKIHTPALNFPRPRVRRSRTDTIVVHHLDAQWDVRRVHADHLGRGWNGIGYNFHVAKDGTISEGRGSWYVGAHTEGFNSTTVGIGCEGQYHTADREMPDAQFNALVWLIKHLRGIFGDIPIKGHRDLTATACPGQFFPLDELRRLELRGQNNEEEVEMRFNTIGEIRQRFGDDVADRISKAISDGVIQRVEPLDIPEGAIMSFVWGQRDRELAN